MCGSLVFMGGQKYLKPHSPMKRLIYILFLALSCTAVTPERDLAEFLQTRSDEPLNGTIWEHKTGEQYNRYLYFSRSDVSLFYGVYEDGELQRWSDFYTSPYLFDGNEVETALTYPKWGENEHAYSITIIRSGEGYTISAGGEEYTYYGPYTEDIEGQWTLIIASPMPWE